MKEFTPVSPESPHTFVQDTLKDLNLEQQDQVRFIDIHERQLGVPPLGFYIGENEYIVGSGKFNPEAQFLMTDKIVDCTGVTISDGQRQYSLLAHVYSTRNAQAMLREFRQAMYSPDEIDIIVIPGFRQTAKSSKRLQEIVEASLEQSPRSLSIDIAQGDENAFRGILVDSLSGQIAELAHTIEPDQAKALNTYWGKPIK